MGGRADARPMKTSLAARDTVVDGKAVWAKSRRHKLQFDARKEGQVDSVSHVRTDFFRHRVSEEKGCKKRRGAFADSERTASDPGCESAADLSPRRRRNLESNPRTVCHQN